MYYGNCQKYKYYGPIFNRVLGYLWNDNGDRIFTKRNLTSLTEVLGLCYVLETLYAHRNYFLIFNDFSFWIKNGYISYDDSRNLC